MSVYVKANGKSINPSRGAYIVGWLFVKQATRKTGRWHLYFSDGSTGCRADPENSWTAKGKAIFPGKETPRCKFCQAVEHRYMRDAGVALYNALAGIFGELHVKQIALESWPTAQKALLLARNIHDNDLPAM